MPGQAFSGQYPVFIWESGQVALTPAYGGGDGSSGSPYQISNVNHIYSLMLDSTHWTGSTYFAMTSSIDLAGVNVSPIGNAGSHFGATFNGGGYAISNLSIPGNNGDNSNIGLFGYLGPTAEVKNFTINTATITGYQYVGTVAGYAESGSKIADITLNNITVTGGFKNIGGMAGYTEGSVRRVAVRGSSVIESNSNSAGVNVGGLVGQLYATSSGSALIEQSLTAVGTTVRAGQALATVVGGVVGSVNAGCVACGIVKNNYSLATVYSAAGSVGGIVGGGNGYEAVQYNYFAGTSYHTAGAVNEGGIVGYKGGNVALTDNYYDSTVCAAASGKCASGDLVHGRGLSTALMKSLGTYLRTGNWDFVSTWAVPGQAISGQYPRLIWESGQSQFPLSFAGGNGTSGSPYLISTLTHLFALMIDSSKWAAGTHFQLTTDLDFAGVESGVIGSSAKPFHGVFDGNYRQLSNFKVQGNSNDNSNLGLFGYASSSSTIKNLVLSGITVTGKQNIGGLVGYTQGIVSRVSVRGTSLIESTAASATNYVGGIVGQIRGAAGGSALIEQSNTGPGVTVRNTNAIAATIGGIVGISFGQCNSCAIVKNNYSRASVSSGAGYVGGIIGHASNYETVQYNYFAGTANNLAGATSEGGIVGYKNANATLTDNYFDSTVCAAASSNCSSTYPGATGTSTTNLQIKSYFPISWNFSDVWKEPAVQPDYMILYWE
jgi:hypothetical protein